MKRIYFSLMFLMLLLSFGCSVVINPTRCEINVKQGTTDILSVSGFFNFGSIPLNFSQSITFTIENQGLETLFLNGNPKVNITGPNANEFAVDTNLTQYSIQPNLSTTFVINFAPQIQGNRSATVSIINNDKNENPYTFSIYGTGISVPEINLKKGSENIPNGSWTHNFGEVQINETSAELVITIENIGVGTLQLTNTPDLVEITGPNAAMFSVYSAPKDDYIEKDKTTPFSIVFSPTYAGIKNATISIANNDSDNNPYTFAVTGTCITPEINVQQDSIDIPCSTGSYDFGTVGLGTPSSEIIFVIENQGIGLLKLNGSPRISTSGGDSAMFDVNESSTNTNIAGGSTTTFTVTFTPTSEGQKTTTVSIDNNDTDENPYTFELKVTCVDHVLGSAIGWIGDGSNGWKTTNGASSNSDYKSFCRPARVCTDSSGNIYVTDYDNNRVCKWDKNGNAIGWIGGGSNGWKTSGAPNYGRDYKSFYMPVGLKIDTNGDIYVTDAGNHRICKWDKNGNAIGWIGDNSGGWKTSTTSSTAWGNSHDEFYSPCGVDLDSSGNIYIADAGNHRVCKWDKNGYPVGWIGCNSDGWKTSDAWGTHSSEYHSFYSPSEVSLDSAGNIYVADNGNHRICKWNSSGTALGWIGGGSDGWKTTSSISSGSDYQSFYNPRGVKVTSDGFIYVVCRRNRICKWNVSGNAIGWLGGGSDGWKTTSAPSPANDYQSLNRPYDVYVDNNGQIFVADMDNHRICKWWK